MGFELIWPNVGLPPDRHLSETLIAFDFDGTLSDAEMTVLPGERAGVAEQMEVITARAMNDALAELAARRDTTVEAAVAVGDGANDRPMLNVAGLAVGYEPKPAVESACDELVGSMTELAAVFERAEIL